MFDSRCFVAISNWSSFTYFFRQIYIPKISEFTKKCFFPSLVNYSLSQQCLRSRQAHAVRDTIKNLKIDQVSPQVFAEGWLCYPTSFMCLDYNKYNSVSTGFVKQKVKCNQEYFFVIPFINKKKVF